ncbi:TetR/AcrR family transcriptional regulator [Paenibacillus cremeus]|uniref:TetR/AcrR family transcriptional regulator n=1 Tax=Paenibacillus cremeus TaxID=2163881 RepID=A0A559K5R5_9BACL|nr:TetR/AcrR family transcriptional regulator [Paenibacillus cremeus]TVY07437.1 TetR/AcrR family transcriptional regulator [Paenibacillus cremeus]
MAEEKKTSLIASALKLFEEKGYHATKVSDIVKDAGMAQGTFYLYFKSKEDLYRSVAEACLDEIAQALAQGSSDSEQVSEDTIMYRIIRQTLTIYYHNRTILNIINQHGAASPEIVDISRQFYARMAGHITQILKHFGAYPGYTDEQLEMTAYAKIGMVEMAAYQWFIERRLGLEKIDALTEILVGVNINCKPEVSSP